MTEAIRDAVLRPFVGSIGESPRMTADRLVADAYGTWWNVIYRRVLTLTRDAAAAEDIAQESFVRLSTMAREGRMPDNVGAWLHRVSVNLVASRGRHASVVDRRQSELVDRRTAPSPEALSIDAEERAALRDALQTLATTDREAVLLAAHGFRGPEIARRLNRTEGATRTLLCRARSKLRTRLVAAGYDA